MFGLLHFEEELGFANFAKRLFLARLLDLFADPGLYALLMYVAHRAATLARHEQLHSLGLLLAEFHQQLPVRYFFLQADFAGFQRIGDGGLQ